jgi:hypothetical protein
MSTSSSQQAGEAGPATGDRTEPLGTAHLHASAPCPPNPLPAPR